MPLQLPKVKDSNPFHPDNLKLPPQPQVKPVRVNYRVDYTPIETYYEGCYFRSRTEARWAVALDYIGWKWEYELEGFELPGGWYLPDFALLGELLESFPGAYPGVRLWIEVKGVAPDNTEHTKLAQLVAATKVPGVFAIGTPKGFNLSGYYWDEGRGCTFYSEVVANIGCESYDDNFIGHNFFPSNGEDRAAICAAKRERF